jgi:hypothetical protein
MENKELVKLLKNKNFRNNQNYIKENNLLYYWLKDKLNIITLIIIVNLFILPIVFLFLLNYFLKEYEYNQFLFMLLLILISFLFYIWNKFTWNINKIIFSKKEYILYINYIWEIKEIYHKTILETRNIDMDKFFKQNFIIIKK